MGTNFHADWIDNSTTFRAAQMNVPLGTLDRGITYLKNVIMSCDGDVTWNKVTGALTWAGTLRIHFNRADGQAIQNTITADSITIPDGYFAYVDLAETNDSVVIVAVAAISTGAASNFLGYNRIVLAYRNAATDELFPVYLRPIWGAVGTSAADIETDLVFIPEYAGAVLTKSGSNNDGGTLGMTSDVSEVGNESRNYYQWSSSILTGLQSRDVFLQVRLPDTFKAFRIGVDEAMTVEICTEETATTNNKLDVTIQKNGIAGTSALSNQTSSVAATWKIIGFDDTNSVLQSLIAGNILNIRLRLYSQNSKYTRIGKVTLRILEGLVPVS